MKKRQDIHLCQRSLLLFKSSKKVDFRGIFSILFFPSELSFYNPPIHNSRCFGFFHTQVCYTFNSISNSELMVTEAGSSQGLRLRLSAEQYDYFWGYYTGAGFEVFIHFTSRVPTTESKEMKSYRRGRGYIMRH